MLKSILGPMRGPFLLLTPACVSLGVGTAVWTKGTVNLGWVGLVLLGAVAAHISVNALNEYFDFRSGLDLKTRRTPFSGGSGTLPENPARATWALWLGLIAAGVTTLVGGYFALVWGWQVLPLGLVGLGLVVVYTTWVTRYPLLCLVAPGLGFGPFMVVSTHLALTGEYAWPAWVASLVPFFLVSNLLLLNQFPDAEADRTVGRRHLLIVAGPQASAGVYCLFLFLAYGSVVGGVCAGLLPLASLLGLGALVLAVPLGVGVFKHARDLNRLLPYLGLNVIVNLLTPTLVAVGLLLR